jgi:hypothetical protein
MGTGALRHLLHLKRISRLFRGEKLNIIFVVENAKRFRVLLHCGNKISESQIPVSPASRAIFSKTTVSIGKGLNHMKLKPRVDTTTKWWGTLAYAYGGRLGFN